MSPATVRAPRTQEQRASAMRKRLMDATIETLNDRGYSGTTTLEVQKRAGVSRGGLLHHYSSRDELILAAVEHLAQERIAATVATLRGEPPDNDRIGYGIRIVWDTFQGPLYAAALELWVAARNDADLRSALVPQERMIGRAIRGFSAELFGSELATHPRFVPTLEIVMDAMRGAAARAPVRTSTSDERLIAEWIDAMTLLLS